MNGGTLACELRFSTDDHGKTASVTCSCGEFGPYVCDGLGSSTYVNEAHGLHRQGIGRGNALFDQYHHYMVM